MKPFRTLAILLGLVSTFSYAQVYPYKNLVFEGAGIRGIAYAGILEEFEKASLLDDIEKVGGTSAGAIIALPLALGYSAAEINNLIYTTDFNKFNDGRFIFFGGIHRMKKHYGWYRGDEFSDWLGRLIARKTGNAEITFSELHTQGYKDLYITATCLNKQKLLIFSHETYPNMKVKDAVRVSMSIPLYFQAVFIDSSGAVIKKPGKRTDLDVVVDGGIIGNFPIQMFDHTDAAGRVPNPETIGIRIDSDTQIEYDTKTKELAPIRITGFSVYMEAFYVMVLENLNRNALTDADWKRTISVSSANIGPRVKKLSATQKESLLNSGRKSARQFIEEMN
ncbi:patatin-like phospholipase family protein [Paradesertivirga mongoliensis]|uniref:Patatin-like phospholipase family protein n=1 Tax=Paradesertivirga mongoliensis TaxID=2100740 RepID=A0ABW4ZGX7_9SPHI|nr:patatin-like phospholipase family protein [Pedobacter mongoliensis]